MCIEKLLKYFPYSAESFANTVMWRFAKDSSLASNSRFFKQTSAEKNPIDFKTKLDSLFKCVNGNYNCRVFGK